ncbi:hypothetical protein PFICI_08505 [Pestalotiopsis fici W106-1]|uniref:Heterokaryon incompatibility domain-containing protein n=1 Tax=Pestalotiopsis fici (strain W106-1 / CGMCC3.15140) TaxID=1229662 RepID=W3WZU0_PESFW|nr:uncharacterized protein PFICI_08505 [Pestalotiopsis fici W106-1]ETS78652.1 hypothetical protein PFICI_08505 [Pestalotiopsis fici W106-1]
MSSDKRDYWLAWVLSSYNQQTAAHTHFSNVHQYFSSNSHVTYAFGTVRGFNVVMASPADMTDSQSTAFIISELMQYAPAVRTGFIIRSDAIAAPGVKLGDVVVGGALPDLRQGVTYFDAEKTMCEERLVVTGQSGRVSNTIAMAIETHSWEGHHSWLASFTKQWRACHCESAGPTVAQCDEYDDLAIESEAHLPTPSTHYGGIAISSQPLLNHTLLEGIATERNILCFETASLPTNSLPFLVVAGIANSNTENKDRHTYENACLAVMSYIASVMLYIDPDELLSEPPISELFVYESLEMDQPGYRLLRLQAGAGPIECHLFQSYLPSDNDDITLVPYEALSYCWGSNVLTNTIRVNGKLLAITSNLFEALKHLRFSDKDRILWVDAICIDQNNVLERGHQVDMMGKLYSMADEVLIWLGQLECGKLLPALQRFEAEVPCETWKKWLHKDPRFRGIWDMMKIPWAFQDQGPVGANLRSELELLMESPWFSRVWIIQEVAQAKRASLGCTEGWIKATTFAAAPNLLEVEPSTQCQAIIDVMPGPSRLSSWFGQNPNMSTLLWRFRSSQASDPRDRLYALLGISSDKPIVADYRKTEQEVVKEFLKYLLQGKFFQWQNHASSVQEILGTLRTFLESEILGGADIHDVERLSSRHMKPLVLTMTAVDYLRYVKSPLLHQLSRQGAIIMELDERGLFKGIISFPSFWEKSKKIRATSSIFGAARRNGLDFTSQVLAQVRDDLDMNDDVVIESAKNGPSVLNQFLINYGVNGRSNGRTTVPWFYEQVTCPNICGSFKILKRFLDRAGLFLPLSQKWGHLLDGLNMHTGKPDVATLWEMDSIFQVSLQHFRHAIKETDRSSLGEIRGGQDVIRDYLESCGDRVQVTKEDMTELVSKYSIEVFFSSVVEEIEIMEVDIWPSYLKEEMAEYQGPPEHRTMAWKVMIPRSVDSPITGYRYIRLPESRFWVPFEDRGKKRRRKDTVNHRRLGY